MQTGSATVPAAVSQPAPAPSPPHQSTSLQSPAPPPKPASQGVPTGASAFQVDTQDVGTRRQSPAGSLPPPVPASLPSIDRQRSLAETLKDLQGQVAFVPRSSATRTATATTSEIAAPASHAIGAGQGVGESVSELYIAGLTARELFVRLPEVCSPECSLQLPVKPVILAERRCFAAPREIPSTRAPADARLLWGLARKDSG